jgi:glycosyl transferase family 87
LAWGDRFVRRLLSQFSRFGSRRTWLRLGVAIVAIAFATDLVYRNDPIGVDFHTYLAAANVGIQQGWSHIYDQGLVAIEQSELLPNGRVQPFLSPPFVAWLAAILASLPYNTAFVAWAAFSLLAFAAALAWSGVSTGPARWIAVFGALAPWWVMHAVNIGQVVPLVAASTVVGWRLIRDENDIAAGVVLSAILLKPNTAVLVPAALLFAGRYRAFLSWSGSAATIFAVGALTLGSHGISEYVSQLTGPLPTGADNLTIHGALGLSGPLELALRVLVVGAVLVAAYKLRRSPGLVLPVAIVGSLLAAPYLHGSDLCLLSAAAWMVWEERPTVNWRVPMALGWLLASPFLDMFGLTPKLNQWPFLEFVLLGALIVVAWRPFTGAADLRTRAPA